MLISTQRENSADPSDPLVDSFPEIPSDFLDWSDPLTDLFSWKQTLTLDEDLEKMMRLIGIKKY